MKTLSLLLIFLSCLIYTLCDIVIVSQCNEISTLNSLEYVRYYDGNCTSENDYYCDNGIVYECNCSVKTNNKGFNRCCISEEDFVDNIVCNYYINYSEYSAQCDTVDSRYINKLYTEQEYMANEAHLPYYNNTLEKFCTKFQCYGVGDIYGGTKVTHINFRGNCNLGPVNIPTAPTTTITPNVPNVPTTPIAPTTPNNVPSTGSTMFSVNIIYLSFDVLASLALLWLICFRLHH